MADLWLRNVRLPGGEAATDLVVRAGRIDAVGVAPGSWSGLEVDGRGRLALPGLVDGHAHVDKTLWGLSWRPHSAGAGPASLIEKLARLGGDRRDEEISLCVEIKRGVPVARA